LGREPSVSRKLLPSLGGEVMIDLQRRGSEIRAWVTPAEQPGL
jgi:hypothetical protein